MEMVVVENRGVAPESVALIVKTYVSSASRSSVAELDTVIMPVFWLMVKWFDPCPLNAYRTILLLPASKSVALISA